MNGIDLCYHQGDVDWKKVKAAGIDFIIPRCGWDVDCDGKWVDPMFLEYVSGAQNVGISVPGVYHFIYAHDEDTARQNAACAINAVRKAGLPKSTVIWCDQEEDTVIKEKNRGYNVTIDMQRKITKAFCDYCLEQGYCTGVYVYPDYLNRVYGKDIVNQYDIWCADLRGTPCCDCLYHQYNVTAWIDGIGTQVDRDRWIGTYTAGTAKPKGDDKDMSQIVYTEKQLTDILKKLGSGNPGTDYNNSPPYNLLYWSGSRWSADCVNLYKALFNGRSIVNPAPGSFQSDLSNTGDCTEWGLLSQCTDRRQDFSMLGNHFRCLYMDGHFGGYLGYEWEEPGQGIVNVVEATPRWEGGIQYSYVDAHGYRRWAKGKTAEGQWTWHGLATPWIDYSGSQPEPTPAPTPSHKEMTTEVFVGFLPELKQGSVTAFVGLLQKCLRYTGDYSGTVDESFGPYTTNAVKAYQQANGLYVDGIVGPKTWTKLIGK